MDELTRKAKVSEVRRLVKVAEVSQLLICDFL